MPKGGLYGVDVIYPWNHRKHPWFQMPHHDSWWPEPHELIHMVMQSEYESPEILDAVEDDDLFNVIFYSLYVHAFPLPKALDFIADLKTCLKVMADPHSSDTPAICKETMQKYEPTLQKYAAFVLDVNEDTWVHEGNCRALRASRL